MVSPLTRASYFRCNTRTEVVLLVVLFSVEPSMLGTHMVHSYCSLVSIVKLILVSSLSNGFLETIYMIQVESVFLDCSNTCCDACYWNGIVCGKSTLAF